ncbi:Oligopeptide transport ATP-binding protein OppF [bacterium YEK0313]|nr:Oligopeptide transport ATP-binding protein OppF [bacterium YEK0313]
MTTPIISVEGVSKRFAKEPDLAAKLAGLVGAGPKREVVHALDTVDLAIRPGEVMGLVGESGSGKSTLGRIIAGIWQQSGGKVHYEGRDRATLTGADRRASALAVQMVFQDPMSSLNPRMRIEDIVSEAPVYHGIVDKAGAGDYLADLMRKVGLDPAYAKRYPHQFSGGQRARIGIARALAVKPKLIVADESVAALDVSIQAQVLNLFMQLRADFGLTYLFISHDLGVVRHVADRVAILYLGRIVELAPAEDLFAAPNHPYTRALLAEVPRVDTGKRRFKPIEGEIPSPLAPPPGCHFHPRCPLAQARCRTEVPAFKEIAPGRFSACHLND